MENTIAAKPVLQILIIDDAALVLKRMQEMLQEMPIAATVFTAASSGEAMNIITEKRPDIILLDIVLGESSGLDILHFVKKEHPYARVIIVSNKATPYYRQLFKENGADAFADKSKEFEQLAGIIQTFL